jgi:hypothetical protein
MFANALALWGKEENYATTIGVTKSILSDIKGGRRVLKLRDCLPLLDKPKSAAVFLGYLCERAGLAPPPPKRTVTKREVESTIARRVRRCIDLYEMVRRHAAAELGADVEAIDLALDEQEAV